MFCEVILGKINAKDVELFRNGSVYEFYRLKALITLEQVDYFWNSDRKKRRILRSKTSWSGVVNFHYMQMAFVMSMRFIVGDD